VQAGGEVMAKRAKGFPRHRVSELEVGNFDWCVDPDTLLRTACKHGFGSCERCGTTDNRDVKHVTRGGVGVVGRLSGRRRG
jgi:hypothetical protein